MENKRLSERELFLQAFGLPAGQQEAFLSEHCRNDPMLLQRLQLLLKEGRTADRVFDEIDSGKTIDFIDRKSVMPARQQIDRYKLLEKIGEGGMAIVYMAQQEQPIRRKVALKIIKPGMDSANVLARFDAERQALARMDHPHIATIFDGGATDDGFPYFVMELVRGVPVTQYCDEHRLGTEARLRLFIRVCQAIEHAHQKGIIHRDLKPSNILVTTADDRPIPKIIDFGIAKATEDPLTDKTLFTRFHFFVGTPAYMSPEQANTGSVDIDTRTDIYALGALLYEILTGKTPFDPRQLGDLESCRRTIQEKEPQLPSSRIAGLTEDELSTTAGRRRVDPRHLSHVLKSDLDWITMKCLEKDRTRRYETATSLADDLNRFLNHENVVARPPSLWYRATKFTRRNKLAVGFASLIVLASVVSSWQAVRATLAVSEQNRLRGEVEVAFHKEEEQRKLAEDGQAKALHRAYTSDMSLAGQALNANNYGKVVNLLERYNDPDLRGLLNWEWRYYRSQTGSDALFALPQQPDAIAGLDLSDDGKILLCSLLDGHLTLWNLDTGTELLSLHDSQQFRPVFSLSSDGKYFATTAVSQNQVRVDIWKVSERKVIRSFPLQNWPRLLAFRNGSRNLLICDRDLTIEQLNLETGTVQDRYSLKRSGDMGRISIAISRDTTRLAAVVDQQVRVWDLDSGKSIAEFEGFGGETWSLSFSPDGNYLSATPTSSASSTDILVYSLANGTMDVRLKGHRSWVPSTAFLPQTKKLVSAGADQTIRIWPLGLQEAPVVLKGHHSEIYRVVVSNNGKRIVSGGKDGSLLIWDPRQVSNRDRFDTLPIPAAQLTFTPDTGDLLVLDDRGRTTVWDAQTLQPLESIASLGSGVRHLLVSPTTGRVFALTKNGTIKVLDWSTRQLVTEWTGQQVKDIIGLSQNGKLLSARLHNHQLFTWNVATGKIIRRDELPPEASQSPVATLSPNTMQLAFGGTRQPLWFLDLTSMIKSELVSAAPWGATDLAFSPDGRLLAASSLEGDLHIWDSHSRVEVRVMKGHLIGVNALAFSPDGSRLATASQGDEAVKLWDVETGLEVATLTGSGLVGSGLAFSPDGALLVGVNAQQEALIWRAPNQNTSADSARTAIRQ